MKARLCDITSTPAKPVFADIHDHQVEVPGVGTYVVDLSEKGLEKLRQAEQKMQEALAEYEAEKAKLEEELRQRLEAMQAELMAKSGLGKYLREDMRVTEVPEVKAPARKAKTSRKRRTRRPIPTQRAKVSTGPSDAEIREWARGQDMKVSDRGAIKKEIREAFTQAHETVSA